MGADAEELTILREPDSLAFKIDTTPNYRPRDTEIATKGGYVVRVLTLV